LTVSRQVTTRGHSSRQVVPSPLGLATHPRRIGSTKDAVGAPRALDELSPDVPPGFTGSNERG
jgi:hypothetical protein